MWHQVLKAEMKKGSSTDLVPHPCSCYLLVVVLLEVLLLLALALARALALASSLGWALGNSSGALGDVLAIDGVLLGPLHEQEALIMHVLILQLVQVLQNM